MEVLFIIFGFLGFVFLAAVVVRICEIIEKRKIIKEIVSIFKELREEHWNKNYENQLWGDLRKQPINRLKVILRENTDTLSWFRAKKTGENQ